MSPFSEQFLRLHRSTWRIDAAIRTPSPGRNLWTAAGGTRGAAPGGSAIRLAGAFSTDREPAEPYVRAQWIREGGAAVTVVDEAGLTWATDLPIRPASTVDFVAGVELEAIDLPATGARFAFDLWFGAEYRTWEDVASGVYLPNVVDSARSIPVTTGDTLAGRTGPDPGLHHQRVPAGPDRRRCPATARPIAPSTSTQCRPPPTPGASAGSCSSRGIVDFAR